MAISAHEFRIGNLIQYNEGGECKVIGIHEFGIDVEFPEETTYIEYDQFSPIPLTEEWLLNLGFSIEDDNPKQKLQYEGDILFKISDFVFSNSEKGQNGGFYCYEINQGKTIIKYVHSLQNLYFALTGEELKLN